jgi:hypothetical protein
MAKHKKTESSIYDIYKSFSDLALMTLGAFLFLFVIITLVSQMTQQNEVPRLKKQLTELQAQLKAAKADNDRLKNDVEKIINSDPVSATNTILEAAGVNNKDFELFVSGLKAIPGKDLHLVVDATGSMHGVSAFLIPILRLIVSRAGKEVSAITWYSDNRFDTYTGTMAEMFDQLVQGAPFSGSIENIGRAFRTAQANAPRPGAYLLIGDEPSDDTVAYSEIPAPVFTLPFGLSDPDTERDFATIAEKTGGMKLHLDLK